MRIDRIRITALASLRAAQPPIDLATHFADAGLIAVTGATGAGKSTLFDAVCLALYDQTPRLSGSHGDPRELLSRGCSEARVEVDLRLDDGSSVTARWSVHRAHRRVEERLQHADLEILAGDSPQVIAAGKTAVRTWVQHNIGLSFDQFRSVVMLSQGDFARFLHESSKDKAALLEKLTGTSLYSELGKAAHERALTYQRRIAESTQRIDAMPVMADAVRATHAADIAALAERITALGTHLAEQQRIVRWWQDLAQARHALARARSEHEVAQTAQAAATAERDRLASARAAAGLAKFLHAVGSARQELQQAQNTATTLHDDQRRTEAAQNTARQALAQALASTDAFAAAVQQALDADPGARRITATMHADLLRAQDAQARAQQDAAQSEARYRSLMQTLDQVTQQVNAARAAQEAGQAEVDTLRNTVSSVTAARDALLAIGDAATLSARAHRLEQALTLVSAHAERVLDALQVQHEAASAALAAAQTALVAAQTTRTATADMHAKALALLAAQRHSEDLAAFAGDVVPGQPCPLCGSSEHPAPLAEPTSIAALRQGTEAQVRILAETLAKHEREVEAAHTRHTHCAAAQSSTEQRVQQAQDAARAREREWARLQTLDPDLGPLATATVADLTALQHQVREAVAQRTRAQADCEAAQARLADRERRHADSAAKLAALHATAQQHHEQVATAKLHSETTAHAAEQAQHHFRTLVHACAETAGDTILPEAAAHWLSGLGDRLATANRLEDLHRRCTETLDGSAAAARARLPAGIHAQAPAPLPLSEAAWKSCVATLERALDDERNTAQRHANVCERVQQQVSMIANRSKALTQAETALTAALATSRFSDEAALRAALMTPEHVQALEQTLADLDRTSDQAKGRHDEAARRLEAHVHDAATLGIDTQTLPEDLTDCIQSWEARCAAIADERDEAVRARTARETLVSDDDARRRSHADQRKTLEALEAEAQPWADLKDLIGSHDGSTFRGMAQAFTLDQLLILADRRLEHIAPRYRLLRSHDADDPWSLAINVIDLDQAGERRPVATLSGGETFLVSLALALALADLRRRSLHIGTLFIDEGFAALDVDTLDQALTVLERLQAEQGTQILVISHVGALEDRIAHRIHVERLGSGRSRLRLFTPEGEITPASPASAPHDAAASSDGEALCAALRTAGGSLSSAALRRDLDWTKARFDRVRDALLTQGRIIAPPRSRTLSLARGEATAPAHPHQQGTA